MLKRKLIRFCGTVLAMGLTLHGQVITTGKSVMSNSSWTSIRFSAPEVKLNSGIVIKPTLEIKCVEKHRASIFLESGVLNTTSASNELVPTPKDSVMMSMKLDDEKPMIRRWDPTADPTIFEYATVGPSLVLYTPMTPPAKLIKSLMQTTTLYIEYLPADSKDPITAAFPMKGLQEAIAASANCRL